MFLFSSWPMQVNAYECVRVVASSYRSKYFIGIHANDSQENFMASYMKSRGMMNRKGAQQIFQDERDGIESSENNANFGLSNGHKLTLIDLPQEPCIPQVEKQLNDETSQVDDISMKKNKFGNKRLFVSGAHTVYTSILPWINGDGSTNNIIYKGLTRRVLGTVMQNPGILEVRITSQFFWF